MQYYIKYPSGVSVPVCGFEFHHAIPSIDGFINRSDDGLVFIVGA